jgi:hypothetical protein
MNEITRKKSPRAPSLALDDALQRIAKVYDKERLHAAPIDVVAQHLGYKSANNGAALTVIASLRYFGLLDRPRDGVLAVTKDVEAHRFAPDATLRAKLLRKFLSLPTLYAELLDKYQQGLPSDANLRFELIQERGFAPVAAEAALACFRRSVEFVVQEERAAGAAVDPAKPIGEGADELSESSVSGSNAIAPPVPSAAKALIAAPPAPSAAALIASTLGAAVEPSVDRIPIRLQGGRRAFIEIPQPFYESDRERVVAQLKLLLVDDDGDERR